jgi:hypothetical protein
MTTTRQTRLARLAVCGAALVAALALGGCSVSIGTGARTVSPEKIAEQLKGIILDASPDITGTIDVTCPAGDVALKDGTTVECELLADASGERYRVTGTISEVNGSDYKLAYQVDPTPISE